MFNNLNLIFHIFNSSNDNNKWHKSIIDIEKSENVNAFFWSGTVAFEEIIRTETTLAQHCENIFVNVWPLATDSVSKINISKCYFVIND